MRHLQELMNKAAELEALELDMPMLALQQQNLKEIAHDRKTESDWAKLEAKNWEEPTFFQRLLGRVAEKQEKAQAEARQAAAAYEEVRRELDAVEHQLNALQEAYAALAGSREAYDTARAEFLRKANQEEVQQLHRMEVEAFRPVAIEVVRQIRKSLHSARGWMQKDLQPRHFTHSTRRMEFIQLADDYAEKLQSLLVYFPEESITLGASMSSPGAYIRSVSTNLSQIDLLNIAIEQSLRVQAQLEAL